jgi:HEAT repeat protein
MSSPRCCPICLAIVPDNQAPGPCPACKAVTRATGSDWWTGAEPATLMRTIPSVAFPLTAKKETAGDRPKEQLPEGAFPWAPVALGLGVLGFALTWLPQFGLCGLLLGVPGLVVGLLGAWRSRRAGRAALPLTAAVVGLQAALVGTWFTFAPGASLVKSSGTSTHPAPPDPPRPGAPRQRTVQELLDDTASTHPPATRAAALEQLGDLSEGLGRAVPILTEILVDPEQDVAMRTNAARALGRIGPPARAAYPVLQGVILEKNNPESLRVAAEKARDQLGQPGPGDLPRLLEDLRHPRAEFRRAAAQVLTWIVDPGSRQTALEPLEKALADDNEGVRVFAAQSVYLITRQADKVLPVLRSLLRQSPDPDVRHWAAYTLAQLGADARPAVPDLVTALEDQVLNVRLWAALAHWGLEEKPAPVLPVFQAVLRSKNPQERSTAARALAKLGPHAAPAVPALLVLLDDPDTTLRALAAQALAAIGPKADQAVPRLCAMARGGSYELRAHALYALAGIGPGAVQAVPTLVELLTERDPRLRGRAAEALARIGKPAHDAVPELEKALAVNGDPLLRVLLAKALWSIDERGRLVLPVLIEVVADDSLADATRIDAARVLGHMGMVARAAVPVLVVLADKVNDPSGPVAAALEQIGPPGAADVAHLAEALKTSTSLPYRRACVQTLSMLGGAAQDAIPELRATLKDPDPGLRLTVVETLGLIARTREGHAAVAVALPDLRDLLSDKAKEEELTCAALEALANLGIEAKPVLGDVQQLLKAPRPRVRAAAALLLGALGVEGRPALADLTACLKDDSALVRFHAAQAVWIIDKALRQVIPVFQTLLADKDASIRAASATVLGEIGPAAKETLPTLKGLLVDPEEEVRKAVAAAVQKIERGQ